MGETARVWEGDLRVLNGEGQDATMEDMGEKGRPPGEPPDAPVSWVRKVVCCNVGGMPVPEEVVDEEFVESRLRLEFPNGEDGEPVITIEEEVLTAMNSLWKRCMIVRVLGRNVPLPSVSRRLRELWKPKGAMFVMDLPRQFFMVRFELEEEYMAALSGSPWRAFGSYLMVQAWTPEFDPLKDEIVTTPVWVRLSNIPVNFYHKTILMGIAKGLGRPIKVDLTTLNFERGRFARVCVEVNLNKPLKGTVMINGERYFVSYEGISAICSSCGMYGHLVHACPRIVMEQTSAVAPNVGAIRNENIDPMGRETDFTRVGNARRKPEQQRHVEGEMRGINSKSIESSKLRGERNDDRRREVMVSNRFGTLAAEGEMEEHEELGGKDDANKENENTLNITNGDASGGREKTITFGAMGNQGNKKGGRLSSREKPNTQRSPSFIKPKTKFSGPSRGLIYGPIRGDIDLSVSGKRLRVERESVGRPGGAFAGEGEVEENEQSPESASMEKNMQMELLPLDETEPRLDQVGEEQTRVEA
ncbi:hypothetical protein Bca52824_087265 [Brassica carinata]|uniref:DUF4283 domain-containing protein n=1 Tax=Brassica carinata TaxID=52824 RepID=A0A8X7TMS9_BRACI|nr:hypothetical protein Bca52824_087265 [Brassica carinata]